MTQNSPNPVLDAYYADLSDRIEDAQIAQQVADSTANYAAAQRATEAEVATAYDLAMGGEGTFAQAIATLAVIFYNPSFSSSDENKIYNDLAFQQRGMLSNMVSNADWMLQNALKYQTDLFTKLDQLEATYTPGNEVDDRNMSRMLDQIERARFTQIPACEDWFASMKAAYAAIVGQEWKPIARKGALPEKQTQDAIRSRIASLRA